jgi:hypothetical protein
MATGTAFYGSPVGSSGSKLRRVSDSTYFLDVVMQLTSSSLLAVLIASLIVPRCQEMPESRVASPAESLVNRRQ